jgi:hypothetical protein
MLPQPCKIWIPSCSIAGADVTPHVLSLSSFETVCKPYLTGTLEILDQNNLVNGLGIVGGEPVEFTISGGSGLDYSQTMHVLTVRGEPASNNLRTTKYTFQLIGKEYFGDKANMVQKSFQNLMGTDAIRQIHAQFLGGQLSIPIPSTGMLAQRNNWVIGSDKPFKAINDFRKILTFAGFSGANLYFRDKDKNNLVPVEHLFRGGGGTLFEQKNTWGSDWRNVFGAYNAILQAAINVPDGGAASARMTSSMSQGERKVADLFSGKKVFEDAIMGGISDVLGAVAGGHGGEHNFPLFDSTLIPKQNVRDTAQDRKVVSSLVSGPQVTLKVPFQTGISCTAGGSCTIRLAPPTGDATDVTTADRVSGDCVVADVCHEARMTPDQGAIGTTTMRVIRKPG